MAETAKVAAVSHQKTGSETTRFLYFLIAIAVGVIAYFLPLSTTESGRRVLSISLFAITLFMTEPIPLAVTGLIACWLYWVWAGLPVAKAFAGFHMDTPWFILGVLLLAVMVEVTGMAKRISYKIVVGVSSNYASILAAMMLVNFLLTFVIASAVAKSALTAAMAISLVQSYGLSKGSNVGRGLVLAMTYQSGLFDKMILSGAGNIIARGVIESVGHVEVPYALWLIAYLPVTILTIVGCWWLILKLFPPESKVLEGGQEFCRNELKKMGPMSKNEIKTLVYVVLVTLLWATDTWHHIPASKIGVAVGLIGCLPLIGVLKKEDFTKANLPLVIFVGSAMSLAIVMAETDILKALTAAMFKFMAPLLQSASVTAPVLLYWYANVFHLFLANEAAMVAATEPAIVQFAISHGFNPLALGMLWAFAAGGKVFVYQSGVLAVGYAFGYFSAKDLFKFGWWVFVLESLLLVVIIPWYWPLIGLSFR